MVKTLHSQRRGHGFDPWSGNYDDPTCRAMWPKKKHPKTNIHLFHPHKYILIVFTDSWVSMRENMGHEKLGFGVKGRCLELGSKDMKSEKFLAIF